MKIFRPLAALAFLGILAAVAANARAETATLELKRLSSSGKTRVVAGSLSEAIFRATGSQSFNAMVRTNGNASISFEGMNEQTAAFKKLVKTEPKYKSDCPFRGVAKLGTQEYPFALDAVPEKAKSKDTKSKDGKAEPAEDKNDKAADDNDSDEEEKVSADESKADENAEKKSDKDEKEKKDAPLKAVRYNRLYIDLNRNGDLTDDKVVKATPMPGVVLNGSYVSFSFPQVDLTIEVDGTPIEYAIRMSGYMNVQKEFSYAGVQLSAAAYREGEITLDGKTHRVVLIDNNGNGRFDDEIKVNPNVRGGNGEVYPQAGDHLLIDPESKVPDSPYDPAQSKFRNYVSKWVTIDGRFYDVKITPAGDKITLDPSATPLGKVSNPNDGYSAMIYSDQGFLKISGDKDSPSPVPVGEWKLLSYSIDQTETPKPAEEKPKEENKPKTDDQAESKDDSPKAMSKAIKNLLNNAPAGTKAIRRSTVSARATGNYKPVKVMEGETVEMPFGPPYKPVVTSYPGVDAKKQPVTQLSMSLVGMAGENCSNMTVKGGRPEKPKFTIMDPDDKVVESGSFEYG
jgi:hypothetical protein